MSEYPKFSQLSTGLTPLLREFFRTASVISLATWVAFPVLFFPPLDPIHFLSLALPGQDCAQWKTIVTAGGWRKDPGTIYDGCRQLSRSDPDPVKNPALYVGPDHGVAIIDPSRSKSGSDEARSGAKRYFLILISPAQEIRSPGWRHEGWHLARGHSGIRFTFIGKIHSMTPPLDLAAQEALNTFLDVGYVFPATLFGGRGADWFRNLFGILVMGLALLPYLNKFRTGLSTAGLRSFSWIRSGWVGHKGKLRLTRPPRSWPDSIL